MNSLLIVALRLSLSGSFFILFLCCLKPIIRHRLTKSWQYYIWLVVIIRLLIPFSLGVDIWGHSNALPQQETTSEHLSYTLNAYRADENPTPAQSYLTQVVYAWLIWIMVALILLVRKITIYQNFTRYIKAGRTEVSDMRQLEQLGKFAEQLKINQTVELYTNSLISSPLLIGFFKPCIILPTSELSDTDFGNTILHELIHYKRLDMFYKWLVQLTICLHWFNPLVHLMSREISHDCELSCDEVALRTLNPSKHKAYGVTLLNVLTVRKYNQQIASLSLNEGKELMKERLDSILNFKKSSWLTRSAMLLLTVVFLCGFAITGVAAADGEKSIGQPYIYSQTGYYQDGYVFEMGWNLNENSYNTYPNKTTITLTDASKITVSFEVSLKKSIAQPEVLNALTVLLDRLKSQTVNTRIPLEKPLVVSVQYVGDKDVIKLAEEYYNEGKNTNFSAIFIALNNEVKSFYLDKIFKDGKLALFAGLVKDFSAEAIRKYAEKAYNEDKLTFFSVIVPYMTDSELQAWAVKCARDKRVAYWGALLKEPSFTSQSETTFRFYMVRDTKNIDFFVPKLQGNETVLIGGMFMNKGETIKYNINGEGNHGFAISCTQSSSSPSDKTSLYVAGSKRYKDNSRILDEFKVTTYDNQYFFYVTNKSDIPLQNISGTITVYK